MTGLPTEPKEKTGEIATSTVAPRHDPPLRTDMFVSPAPTRTPVHQRAERAVQQLSKWAGPVALVGVVALIAWWIID